MIWRISFTGIITTAALATAFWLAGPAHQYLSVIFGGLLITTNILIIAWVLNLIFIKKSVALALTIIVFKYAGLIILLILLYKTGWSTDFGFIVGLTVMFPVLFVVAKNHIKRAS